MNGLKHQKEKPAWTILWTGRFGQGTSVCIVDETGRIVREAKVASEPKALLAVLKNPAYRFKRIGLEAGPLSQWLFSAVAEAELPVVCVETRHIKAVLKAQINKTDRNDARGMAPDDAGGALPSAAYEEVSQSETAERRPWRWVTRTMAASRWPR